MSRGAVLIKQVIGEIGKRFRQFEGQAQEVVRVISPGPVSKGKPERYWNTERRRAAMQQIDAALLRAKGTS